MAISRTDFFDKKSKGALWDVGVSIKRSNPLPLDADSVFASKEAAEAYAAGVISYPGQVIAVVPEVGTTELYYLDENCSLIPMGSKLVADNKGIIVENGQIKLKGLADATAGQVLKAKANEDGTVTVEWVTDTTADSASQALADAKSELIGKDSDAASADTIQGAKKFASNAVDILNSELKNIAKSGKAADVSLADTAEKFTSENVEDALLEVMNKANANASTLTTLTGEDTVDGSIKKQIKAAKDAVERQIGALSGLTTTEKGTVVGAINELKTAVGSTATNSEISISTTTTTAGMLKSYTIYQGGTAGSNKIGVIDIPKDLVVTEGSVVTNPDAEHVGTFIKLVIANQAAPLYINVANLVDVYTAKASAAEVQLAFNGYEVSATLVNGGVSTAKLADGAVTNAKIANTTISRAKIDAAFEANIKALETAIGEGGSVSAQIQTAIQGLDSTQTQVAGADGLALSVTLEDGKVTGLTGSIAANTYDAYGAASAVLGRATDAATVNTVYGAKAYADAEAKKAYDAITAISSASIEGLFATK